MKKLILLIFTVLAFRPDHKSVATLYSSFSPEKSTMSIKFKDEISSYRTTSMFLLPNEKTTVTLADAMAVSTFILTGEVQGWEKKSESQWLVTAPAKPGLYPVTITQSGTTESLLVNVFVMVPFNRLKNGLLNGYKIGSYPTAPRGKTELYTLPRGFIEVTEENKHTNISPHFKLGQFLCKQTGSYPKYIVLRERLPLKLEALMEQLNEQGVPCHSLSIMSGYRTPHYNRGLGNVRYSRHMWGDAADIFIDSEPRENYMADLNGDGKRDVQDGEVLFQAVKDIEEHPSFAHFVGGLAKYKPTRSHGPFIHVDARGTSKRWSH